MEKQYVCIGCNATCASGYSKRNRFCSNACHQTFRFLTETLTKFRAGELTERKTIRRCLAHVHGYACSVCCITEYAGKPITLQVDHINGNPGDHRPTNLRLLCPNCHSQTEFFSGANKGSGRKSRGLPLN